MKRTRFAPSPTGLLHAGNAFSALQCESWAKKHDAELLLRIEDIDHTRCRPDFTAQILDDLTWLGIAFDGEYICQQQYLAMYQQVLGQLIEMNVLYPCFCTRKDIQQQLQSIYHVHPYSVDAYPRTCLGLSAGEREAKKKRIPFSWRLNQQQVKERLGEHLFWRDGDESECSFFPEQIGDVIIGRKDIQYSYHLAVVVDDARQGITDIIRGDDLRGSTPVHTILQLLLGYVRPRYFHHTLILNDDGQRLAKTKGSISLKALRDAGMKAEDLRCARIKKGL